jgi:hypothetical protein
MFVQRGKPITHQLDVALSDDSQPILIEQIRLFVEGGGAPLCTAGILSWNVTQQNVTAIRFVTNSPFNDEVTTMHARQMLVSCLSWLSTMLQGTTVEFYYMVTVVKAQGVLINSNGNIKERCSHSNLGCVLRKRKQRSHEHERILEREAEKRVLARPPGNINLVV